MTAPTTHVSGGRTFQYPAAGGERPPGGAKVHVLTRGNVCIDAQWSDDPKMGFLGWAPLPMRDRAAEKIVCEKMGWRTEL